MDKYQETFETWNKVAMRYQDMFMHLDLYNATYDFICEILVKPNSKILEIGCGPGNITKYLLDKRPDFEIFGIDVAPNMIELARKNNPNAKFAVMDSREISTIKTKYDGIVCGFCLPYLSETDCDKMILDVKDMLNEGGLLYLSFVEGDPKGSGFKAGSSGDRCFFYYHNLESLKKNLSDNSFGDLNIFKVAYKRSDTEMEMHTILTALKK